MIASATSLVEEYNVGGKLPRRGGDRPDRVGDCDTLEQRIGKEARRLAREEAAGRRCKNPLRPGLAAAPGRAAAWSSAD
jgi:hypothetical protein